MQFQDHLALLKSLLALVEYLSADVERVTLLMGGWGYFSGSAADDVVPDQCFQSSNVLE